MIDEHRLLGLVLDRHVARPGSARAMSSSSRPGHDHLAFAPRLGVDRRSERDLHVGRRELEPAVSASQPDPAEHEHRVAVETPRATSDKRSARASCGTREFQHAEVTTVSESIMNSKSS